MPRQTTEQLKQEIAALQTQLASLQAAHHQQQRDFEDSEDRYRILFGAALEGILIHEQGTILDVNPALLRLFGYTYDELMGQSLLPLIAPEYLPMIRESIAANRQTPYEVEALRKDGTRLFVEIIGTTYTYQGRPVRIVAVRDITARKQAEALQTEQRTFVEALQASAALLNSTLDPETLMERILETLNKVVKHDTANIMLIEAGLVKTRYLRNYPAQEAQVLRNLELPLQEYETFRIMLETGKPICIPDTTTDPRWRHTSLDSVVRSFISAPIPVDGQIIGFLNVDSAIPNTLTPLHAERLQAFADQAAIAIKNAHLYAHSLRQVQERGQAELQLARRNKVLEILNEIASDALAYLDERHIMETIARLATNALEATSAYVSSIDIENMTTTVLAEYLSEEISTAEAEPDLGKTYHYEEDFGISYEWLARPDGYQVSTIDDPTVPESYRRYLAGYGGYATLLTTLWAEGKPFASIEIWDSRQGRQFSQDDINIMLAVARQASMTLSKARLIAALEQSEARNRALLNALPDNMFRLNREGVFLDVQVNDGSNIIPARMIGRTLAQRLPKQVAETGMNILQRTLETGHMQVYEYRAQMGNELKEFEARVVMSGRDEVVVILRDITERKQHEQSLLRRALLLETLNELSREALVHLEEGYILDSLARLSAQVIDATSAYVCNWEEQNGTYTVLAHYISPQANALEQETDLGHIYNISDEFTSGASWIRNPRGYHLTRRDDPNLSDFTRQHLAEYGGYTTLIVPLWVDEEPIGFIEIWESRPERYILQEDIDIIITIARQVSLTLSKARLHTALKESEAQKTAIINALPDLMFRMNAEGRYLDAKVFPDSPLQPAQVVGYHLYDLLPKEVAEQTLDYINAVLKDRTTYFYEYQLPEPDGQLHDYESRMVACGEDEVLCVVRDITARKRNERDLAEARDAALESSRTKSQFLANMSHELRTPLNSIINYTQLLLDGIYGDITPIQYDRMEKVGRNARNLLSLINDVLDLSKIEAGHMLLKRRRVESLDFIQSILEIFKPLAEEKHLFLEFVGGNLPDIYVDEIRARQVLTNIIGNAIKFTHEGGITVVGESDGELLRFTIIDTGIGIPNESQEKIFEEFRQADGSYTREYEGTGLGLTISKRIVEMHGGIIELSSEVGKGSMFHVSFPIARKEDVE